MIQGKTEVRGEIPAPLRFCPLQTSHKEAWDQTRPSAVSTKISSRNTTVYFSQKLLTKGKTLTVACFRDLET